MGFMKGVFGEYKNLFVVAKNKQIWGKLRFVRILPSGEPNVGYNCFVLTDKPTLDEMFHLGKVIFKYKTKVRKSEVANFKYWEPDSIRTKKIRYTEEFSNQAQLKSFIADYANVEQFEIISAREYYPTQFSDKSFLLEYYCDHRLGEKTQKELETKV